MWIGILRSSSVKRGDIEMPLVLVRQEDRIDLLRKALEINRCAVARRVGRCFGPPVAIVKQRIHEQVAPLAGHQPSVVSEKSRAEQSLARPGSEVEGSGAHRHPYLLDDGHPRLGNSDPAGNVVEIRIVQFAGELHHRLVGVRAPLWPFRATSTGFDLLVMWAP